MAGAGREPANGAALLANAVLGGLGLLCLVLAWRMDAGWAGRHFLPVWTWDRGVQLHILLALRLLAAAVGLAIILLLRPWLLRACAAGRARGALGSVLSIALAVLAALLVTELILRTQTWRAVQERWDKEPLRTRDGEYGWAFLPNHAGTAVLDRHTVHYATGPHGYRVPRAGAAPDFARPTIIFAGESILFGYGLDWRDTIPARVEALTGIQSVNISVNAHATDQIYLRLRRELPRFAHPVAVVIPFVPRLLDRNLDTDKPHLDAGLRWHPAGPPPIRLAEVVRRMLRYRKPADIARGEARTTEVLKAAIMVIEARGAKPIVLVPQMLPESDAEREIRSEVLDRAGIPYLLVPLRPQWRSPSHHHPTSAGAAALAGAVSKEIAGHLR